MKRRVVRVVSAMAICVATWQTAAQQRTSVELAGRLYSCLPTAERRFPAGPTSVELSEGHLEDSASEGTGGLSFFASYRCSGYGARSVTIRFGRAVKNVRLRVITMVEPISVNGAPAITLQGVPWGSTNLDVPGPLSILTIEGKGPRGPGTAWYLGVDAISFEEAVVSNLEVRFDLSSAAYPDGARMLIARYRPNDPGDRYPLTGVQLDPDPDGRPRMRIGGFVRDAVTGVPPATARPVYLRLRDPEDTAPYVVKAGHASVGDNMDASVALTAPEGANGVGPWECRNEPCLPQRVLAVQAAAGTGRFEAILTGTKRYAGDNYRVEASLEPDMSCPTPARCSSTAVITAWKRVYVEVNKMARSGAMLTDDISIGDVELPVSDVRHFPREVPFQIMLLHAPLANSTGGQFYAEEHTVERVEGRRLLSWGRPQPGRLVLKAGESVIQPFLGPETVGAGPDMPTERAYLADAVMRFRNDRDLDYFRPDLSRVASLFDDTFVETVWLTDDAGADGASPDAVALPHDGYLPYFEALAVDKERDWVARKWTRSVERLGAARHAHDNHQVLFSAWDRAGGKGATLVSDGFNETWLFEKNIARAHPGKILAHELAHQWRTNQGYSPVTGSTPLPDSGVDHCDEVFPAMAPVPAYTENEACLMYYSIGNIADGEKPSVMFHYVTSPNGSEVDSEYLWIRHRTEPIPQNEVQTRKRYFQ